MAAVSKQSRYGESGVYGSLAYDYGRVGDFNDRPAGRQLVIPAPPRIREEVVGQARVRMRQSISPFAVIGYLCAAVLVVFTLMAKIQLTAVTDQSAHLEVQLAELQVAQNRLLINYEKAFNLTEIEEYASNTLGMQRPRDEQLYYLSSAVPDKAVILEGGGSESFGDRIFDLLASLSEYFR